MRGSTVGPRHPGRRRCAGVERGLRGGVHQPPLRAAVHVPRQGARNDPTASRPTTRPTSSTGGGWSPRRWSTRHGCVASNRSERTSPWALRTADGDVRIEGETIVSACMAGGTLHELAPALHQAGVRDRWGGEDTYGMMKRSIPSTSSGTEPPVHHRGGGTVQAQPLIDAACERTGLSGFGADTWQEGLRRRCWCRPAPTPG